MASEEIRVRCAIAGGGPAGMMLGLLLARAGVDVMVLEKHADFLRDFRGDTLHPSTLEVMHELGLMDELLKLPHQKVSTLAGQFGELQTQMADFSHLPVRHPYIVLMPQWDFLDFLARQGARYHSFRHRKSANIVDLIHEKGRVAGVRAVVRDGELQVRADLTVAADGRHSTVREKAELPVNNLGAPIDVFWFRLARKQTDTEQTGGRFEAGRLFVRIFRGDYWQCAYVIPKGHAEKVRERGLPAFRDDVATLFPVAADRVHELQSWDDIKLLTVAVDRLEKWYRPGLLCIGDAAHAMSPVGGVGINLAIQDAVAAANILAEPLLKGTIADEHLRKVQRRREFPTRMTQRAQIAVQNRLVAPLLGSSGAVAPPRFARLLARWPMLRRIPARMVGMGVRPEHVRTREAKPG